ncbi:MAG: hypothetical protein RL319_633 [Actinomycetota bacterium]|jgi:uncharacterized repeat protein (TIGR02543 family)
MNKNLLRFIKTFSSALVALLLVVFAVPQAANAVPVGTLTIVASGGSTEGTNWTYSANEIVSSATVSVNASDIVAKLALGNLTVSADKIIINTSVVYANASSLSFKSQTNILLDGGVTVQSQGGDIIFNADSDANLTGFVRFGLGATQAAGAVNSNGGRIIVGGGLNPLTTPAVSSNADGQNSTTATACGGTPPVAGIGIFSFAFNSGNGDMSLRASSSAVSGRGMTLTSCSWGTNSFTATGSGSVYIFGDGALSTNNPWGIAAGAMQVSTQSGNITVEGKGSPTGGNSRGMSIGGASSFTSTSGTITFRDLTVGATATDYRGINIGAALTITTGGSFLLSTDNMSNGGSLVLDVSNATIQANSGASFSAATFTVGAITATNADSLTIGAPGNTSAITLNSAISAGGNVNLTGAAITISAALSSTADISITASGTVSQTAAISAVGLAVSGSGNVNLNSASNDVTRFAANTTGTLTFAETNGYSIGSVGSVSGVSAASQTLTVNGATNYRINFNSQGGSTVNPVLFASGGSATLPNGPSLSGYSFRGWFTASSGGTAVSTTYTPGVTSDVTLYAQWALIPPPVNVSGKVTGTGAIRSISGSSFDRISSVLINGAPVKILSNDGSTITFEVPELPAGNHKIELVGSSIKLTWDNAIVVKAPPAPREFQASLAAFTGNSISAKQKTAIKTLVAGATALTCVATAAKTATTAQKKAALAQATSVCNYAKQANTKLTAATAKPTLVLAKKASPIALKVTK